MSKEELFPGFEHQCVATDDEVWIHAVVGGAGPPVLLLHGHPQTHAMWHKVAPALAERFTLVLADLRGYGDSSRPAGDAGHSNYSKRVMARDMLHLMQTLGHSHFSVLAHDRGARVAHRLAADYGEAVQRLSVLDIAPTLAMYEQTNEDFACFRPLDEWRRVAHDVRGEPLPCGHYIAEEAPDALLARVIPFLAESGASASRGAGGQPGTSLQRITHT